MKKYDIFLFDADNTLYDYYPSSVYALKTMFEQHGIDYSGSIQARYNQINNHTWARYEKGEFTVQELEIARFEQLFTEMDITLNVDDFNAGYLRELGKGMFLIEGAIEICYEITSHNKLIYIVTNGLTSTQNARAEYSPLAKYISGVFVSQEIGHQKPDKPYFDHVLKQIPAPKANMLIIGDSLTADIAGGNNAGIDTCWLNTHNINNATTIKPTYEINQLLQMQVFI